MARTPFVNILEYIMKKKNRDLWDTSNSDNRIPYEDREIAHVLTFAPTLRNCELLGRLFKRSSKAIWMIFQIANTPPSKMKYHPDRPNNVFVQQVQKIRKSQHWIPGHAVVKYPQKRDGRQTQ